MKTLVFLLLLVFLLIPAPVLSSSPPVYHLTGTIVVDYIEGRHLELTGGSTRHNWVLLPSNDSVGQALEANIGRQVTICGSVWTEMTVWMKPTIWVLRVW